MIVLAIVLPWLALMLRGKIVSGVVCLALSVGSLFGGIVAIVVVWVVTAAWAVYVLFREEFVELSSAAARNPSPAATDQADYDRRKWEVLLEYDPEVQEAYEQVRPSGQPALDRLARDYLAVNDRGMLPLIVMKICAETPLSSVEEAVAQVAAGTVFQIEDGYVFALGQPTEFHVIVDQDYARYSSAAEMEAALPFTRQRRRVTDREFADALLNYYSEFLVDQIAAA